MSDALSFEEMYRKVVENNYDFGTGTWAVISPHIKMRLNERGEYVPVLKDESKLISKNELELMQQTCLSLSSQNKNDIANRVFSNVPKIKYDKKLGFYSGLYIGHVIEGKYRENGSSGGFGTWIFKELLERGEIDGVIQVKESKDQSKLFEYGISNNLSELCKNAKTRYYPVEFSDVINKIKQTTGNYAIIGLPSYIMEMRLLSEADPEIKARIKFMIGLICGHQKSTKFAEFLAWQCGIKPGDLEHINFRKKMNDGPASDYAIEVTGLINGKSQTVIRRMRDLIGSDWGQGIFKVRASDFTDDVMNETADVTLGDAWLPEYVQDKKGNNVIIVRNPVIQKIIEDGIKNNKISVLKVDEEKIFSSQAAHYRHTHQELAYRLYKKMKGKKWAPKKQVLASNNFPWIRKRIQDKREEICVKVPIIYAEAVKRNDIMYFETRMQKLSKSYKNLYTIKGIQDKIKKELKIH